MWCRKGRWGAAPLAFALAWSSPSKAEVTLAEAKGWVITTDGRVNGFASHVWGETRPEGLENLNWVGFNESNGLGQTDSDNKIRTTRIRSGYVPSTLAFNASKKVSENFQLKTRVEIGLQITNTDPVWIGDPTWMEPRAVWADVSGAWGSVRAGRDFGLFSRGNLFMNYDIGHAYGVGFPCAYEKIFGGACGHVGFGTLWPDFRAQITYSTPMFADIFQISAGVFDPRTVPTFNWFQTPLPRFEGEAVAAHEFKPKWGFKAWVNGFWQQVGTTANTSEDPDPAVEKLEDFTRDAYGAGAGAQGNLGPVKLGVSGYMGRGMDGFVTFTFNPILMTLSDTVDYWEREFRPTRGYLAQASFTLGNTWIMGGFGQALFDRLDNDNPIDTPGAAPLLRSQTGISTGLFHRIDNLVLGIDYFRAQYGFDARLVEEDGVSAYVDSEQTVHALNGGMTVEW